MNIDLEELQKTDIMLLGAMQNAIGERLSTGRWCAGCLNRLQAELEHFIETTPAVEEVSNEAHN